MYGTFILVVCCVSWFTADIGSVPPPASQTQDGESSDIAVKSLTGEDQITEAHKGITSTLGWLCVEGFTCGVLYNKMLSAHASNSA